MTNNHEISPELHTKICKKIAQLTKVIYMLNSKAEEHDMIIEQLNEDHEKEVQRIMYESKLKIEKFQSDCKFASDKEKEVKTLHDMLNQGQKENEYLQKTLRDYVANTELNETQLRNGYENKFLDLKNKLLERKRIYSELLESYEKFQQGVENQKQKEIIQLNSKHGEDLKNVKFKFENDLSESRKHFEEKEKKLVEELVVLQNAIDLGIRNRDNEYELKMNKMKQFYEEELKMLNIKTNESFKLEWNAEKGKLIADYQLKEKEMSSRIHFMENQMGKKEIIINDLEKQLIEVQNETSTSHESDRFYEDAIKGKENKINVLKHKIEMLENEAKVINEKYQTASHRNNDYRNIEEAYGHLSKNLDCYKQQIKTLQEEYSQLEDKGFLLESKLKVTSEENLKLKREVEQTEKEKNDLLKKCINTENKMKEKSSSLNIIEKENVNLQSQLSKEIEEHTQAKIKFRELGDKFSKLKSNHRHLEKQKCILEEKIQVLQRDSSALLEEEKKSFQEERKNTEERFNLTMQAKDNANALISEQLEEYKISLDDARNKLVEVQKETELIRSGLHDKGQTLAKKEEFYQQQISNIKADFQKEKDMMQKNFNKEKLKIDDDSNYKISEFERKWQQKLRDVIEENEMLLKESESRATSTLTEIQRKHMSELKTLKASKEGELAAAWKEIEKFRSSIKLLNHQSTLSEEKREAELADKVDQFKNEKQELIITHNQKILDMKTIMSADMNEKLQALEIEKNHALEGLRCNHEAAVLEIRQEHLNTIKALRSQLAMEKEDSVATIRSQLSHDKQQMQDLLRIQMEERINSLTRGFEKQLEESKDALEQNFSARQQEYLVHSRKIAELTDVVDSGETQNASLNEKIQELEDKAKYLNDELTTKGEEILEIRRESNSRMRTEMGKLENAHRTEKESMRGQYLSERSQDYCEWQKTRGQLDDQVSALRLMLDEMEEKFRQRPSRDEDLEKLNELTQKLFERELECQRIKEERKHYRLELVNREENFNKVFNTSPNVGYINPIELNKRRSSKKK